MAIEIADDTEQQVRAAMRRAFNLGQTYWQQADSQSYAENRRSDETRRKFDELVEETVSLVRASAERAQG